MYLLLRLVLFCLLGDVYQAVAQKAIGSLATEPAQFQFNARGGDPAHGGTKNETWPKFVESPRFRVLFKNNQEGIEARAKTALKHLEASYDCFVGTMGWRSSGVSYNGNQDKGPYYKLNAFAVTSSSEIGGAGGVMGSDRVSGHGFLYVVQYAPLVVRSKIWKLTRLAQFSSS
jgi:hypothetical protein